MNNPCDRCNKEVTTEFSVQDDLWTRITGHRTDSDGYAPGYWCLSCFIAEAERQGDCDFTVTVHCRAQYFEGVK